MVVLSSIFGPKLSYKLYLIAGCIFRQTSDLHPYPIFAVFRKALVLLYTRYTVLDA
jgi:hypothetical protein